MSAPPFNSALKVPPRHSAERHWRPASILAKVSQIQLVPPRHSAERHWRLEISGAKYQSVKRMVPPRHSAERHWRLAFIK